MRALVVREMSPPSRDWRSLSWRSGQFDTARRSYTPDMEGQIRMPHHLILVTLSGGAGYLEVNSECGHRYEGRDSAGAVSFIPAGFGRRFRMRTIRSEWASISLHPDYLQAHSLEHGWKPRIEVPTFTNQRDQFIQALVHEIKRQHTVTGGLSPEYCDAMSGALAHYLCARYGSPDPQLPRRPLKLPHGGYVG
jgi:AraC family transcriptional regulator